MPHVVVKLWPGKGAAEKAALTAAIVREVRCILMYGDASVSVAMEEVPADEWRERVFEPDILGKWGTLTKPPGYGEKPSG